MADLRTVESDVLLLTSVARREMADLWAQVREQETELVERWPTMTRGERRDRTRALQAAVADMMRQARELLAVNVPAVVDEAYTLGRVGTAGSIGRPPVLTTADLDSRAVFAADTYNDLLRATRFVEESTKDLVRYLAREHAADRLTGNLTAQQAARNLARDLLGRQVAAIVYRDGSRHGLADYADMVLRTKTAEAYQVGGFNQARALGVRWMEILDNPECGLDGHDDPTKANGLIVTVDEAARYPISHPRCVRATTPRPDVDSQAAAAAARPSTTAEQNADQARVAQAREDLAARRAAGTRELALEARLVRAPDGRLVPSSGAAWSAAARRRATRLDAAARRRAARRRSLSGTP